MTTGKQIIEALGSKGEELETALTQFKQTEHYQGIKHKLEEFVEQNSTLFDLEAAKIFALLGYAQEFENNRKAKEKYANEVTTVIQDITHHKDMDLDHVLGIVYDDYLTDDENPYREPVVTLDYPGLMKSIYERFPVIKDSFFYDAVLTLWGNLCYGTASFPDAYTALMWAAHRGRTAVVNELLNAGAELEAKDNSGWTALMCAVSRDHVTVMTQLLKAGAELEAKDNSGGTALMCAVSRDHVTVMTQLLKAGAELEAKDNSGWTALIWAARDGNVDVVTELLNLGAELETKDHRGRTALMHAAYRGRTAVVTQLLKAGAELEAKDNSGWTALMWAARDGNVDVVTELLNLGAELETKDKYGETALMLAARDGNVDVVTELLNLGAELETKDHLDRTAFMHAADRGRTATINRIKELQERKESMKLVHSELSELCSSSNLQNAAPANASIHCSSLAMGALTVAIVGVAMAYSQSYIDDWCYII